MHRQLVKHINIFGFFPFFFFFTQIRPLSVRNVFCRHNFKTRIATKGAEKGVQKRQQDSSKHPCNRQSLEENLTMQQYVDELNCLCYSTHVV